MIRLFTGREAEMKGCEDELNSGPHRWLRCFVYNQLKNIRPGVMPNHIKIHFPLCNFSQIQIRA